MPTKKRLATVEELAENLDIQLMDWQLKILKKITSPRPRSTIGVFVPRQNGKSYLLCFAAVYLALVMREQVLFTEHQADTASQMFQNIFKILTNLPTKLVRTRIENGKQTVSFVGGGQIIVKGRTRANTLGQTYQAVILDEAQELTHKELEGIRYTLATAKRPLYIYSGTPPTEESKGDVIRGLREQVKSGEVSGFWFEYGVKEFCRNPKDEKLWRKANPSYGILISKQARITLFTDKKLAPLRITPARRDINNQENHTFKKLENL
jgi:phage terminase large subunit-like protein